MHVMHAQLHIHVDRPKIECIHAYGCMRAHSQLTHWALSTERKGFKCYYESVNIMCLLCGSVSHCLRWKRKHLALTGLIVRALDTWALPPWSPSSECVCVPAVAALLLPPRLLWRGEQGAQQREEPIPQHLTMWVTHCEWAPLLLPLLPTIPFHLKRNQALFPDVYACLEKLDH